MDEVMARWMNESMADLVVRWMDRLMPVGLMTDWIGSFVDGWMDGWMIRCLGGFKAGL